MIHNRFFMPCPMCGEKEQAEMRARFVPEDCNILADQDIVHTRCTVAGCSRCGFTCDYGTIWYVAKVGDYNMLMDDLLFKLHEMVKERVKGWTG